jgi:competence protein ComEA
MSFYRSVLAALAAVAIATPVFAEDAAATQGTTEATPAMQLAENSEAAQTTATEQTSEQTKVNLNKATVKELAKVKGLNASKAKAIVSYRKKHGDFKSTDELARVKGFKKVKPDTLKEITDQLSVD